MPRQKTLYLLLFSKIPNRFSMSHRYRMTGFFFIVYLQASLLCPLVLLYKIPVWQLPTCVFGSYPELTTAPWVANCCCLLWIIKSVSKAKLIIPPYKPYFSSVRPPGCLYLLKIHWVSSSNSFLLCTSPLLLTPNPFPYTATRGTFLISFLWTDQPMAMPSNNKSLRLQSNARVRNETLHDGALPSSPATSQYSCPKLTIPVPGAYSSWGKGCALILPPKLLPGRALYSNPTSTRKPLLPTHQHLI